MPPKKSSGEKKKTAVNTRRKTIVNTKKKTDSSQKKASSSKKKTDSSQKKASSSKKTVINTRSKTVSSSKKPTKSSILSYIKIIAKMMTFIIISAVASKSFINVSQDFTTFLGFLVTAIPLSYGYTVGIQTPTKVDSKKNVIKLPLSKFKLYIKKLLSVVNPAIFYLGSRMGLITAIIFIKTFIVLAITQHYDNDSITQIYKTLIESYKSDLTVYNALSNITFNDFYNKNIVSLLKKYYPADKIKNILDSVSNSASNTIEYLKSFIDNLELFQKDNIDYDNNQTVLKMLRDHRIMSKPPK